MNREKALSEERILDLEKKLLQSVESLDKCKKENEDFIHMASHDLQAPLRKLSTFVERLTHKSRESLEGDAILYIEKINSTVEGMRSLIDGLSALSNVSGADKNFIRCDLNEVLKDALADMELLIKENNVDISAASLPVIDAYPSQIKQVFVNLLDNSIKFHNKGVATKIVISCKLLNTEEIKTCNLSENIVYFKIEFADNGIGFKQEYADKIFKPFQRLHGRSAYTGNGLGLAICKKIINNHGGKIYAEGNENSGARFILILPEMHNP